jgi:hypothetical protein
MINHIFLIISIKKCHFFKRLLFLFHTIMHYGITLFGNLEIKERKKKKRKKKKRNRVKGWTNI